ncbi:MAG: GH32 C-terminal domain-containing protein [Roseateles sp.]
MVPPQCSLAFAMALWVNQKFRGRVALRTVFFSPVVTSTAVVSGQSERHDAPRILESADIHLEIWVDGSTLEVFAEEGLVAISDLVYAAPAATELGFFHGSEDPTVQLFEMSFVRSAMYTAAVQIT